MGRITTGVGLVSGINSGQIIDQLIQLDSAPVTQLQNRLTTANQQKSAYTDLSSKLTTLKTASDALGNPTTFGAATASSSNDQVLTATASNGAAVGSYQFQVAQLVSTQQTVTQGFTDTTNARVGAGTITISMGGGEASSQTDLSSLNGGSGVRRGTFRITDRSGKSADVDISNAITLDDVVTKINTALDINVKAEIKGNALVLTDTSGQTTGDLTVRDLGNGHAATDLGIAGKSGGTDTITGTGLVTLSRNTAMSQLNDGRGVSLAPNGGPDLQVLLGDGRSFQVTLGGAKTVGDVIDAINTAAGGSATAKVASGSAGIQIVDNTGGGGAIVVADLNNSTAAEDLGLNTGEHGTVNGRALLASVDSVLIGSLRGGKGLNLGTISITDRTGQASSIDLSNATSLQDILDAINTGTNGAVTASLNAAGTGVQLTDTTGGSGNLVIADTGSTTVASQLGIAGTFDTSKTAVVGANLHHQWVTAGTALSDYNGGKGVNLGKFRITDSTGAVTTIDLTGGSFNTIGDIIKTINARGLGITAGINDNGNGLLLTDTAGGAGQLKVEDLTGTTAADLNIAGTATNNKIDGAFEKTITTDANDTLATLQQKVQSLGFGVTASIINDGSSAAPYRLSLSAVNSGRNGRFVFDAGSTNLQTQNLVDAQDAAVFVGGSGNANPLLVTSSSNQITNVVKGVTINLTGTSTSPVTLNVARDSGAISKQVQAFVDGYNALIDKITTLTKYDTTTNTAALLLGDGTTQTIQESMDQMVLGVVKDAGLYKTLGDIGVTVGDGGKLSFATDTFAAAYAKNPDAVKSLFSQTTDGLGTLISKQVTKLTDPVSGVITLESQSIDTQTQDYQTRINDLNILLAQKKTRLQTQFANMESVLAKLQSQQQSLSSINSLLSSTTSSGSSNNSSSTSSSAGSSKSSSG